MQYDDFLNQHIQKLLKLGSRPYTLCVLNNSVGHAELTSSYKCVKSYNLVIEQFFIP